MYKYMALLDISQLLKNTRVTQYSSSSVSLRTEPACARDPVDIPSIRLSEVRLRGQKNLAPTAVKKCGSGLSLSPSAAAL